MFIICQHNKDVSHIYNVFLETTHAPSNKQDVKCSESYEVDRHELRETAGEVSGFYLRKNAERLERKESSSLLSSPAPNEVKTLLSAMFTGA